MGPHTRMQIVQKEGFEGSVFYKTWPISSLKESVSQPIIEFSRVFIAMVLDLYG